MCSAYNWWNSDPSKNRSTYSPSVAMSVKKFQYNRKKNMIVIRLYNLHDLDKEIVLSWLTKRLWSLEHL